MQLPARVGKYELVEFLGGGMSHVYRAQDTILGRTVALKILTEAGCRDSEAKKRFLLEARTAGNIVHDNIISVYDFGEDQGRPFIVMEFLRGESLRDAIRNDHTGDLRNKLSLAIQTARALGHIHTRKIIHRDIKPENIYVDLSGKVKLMDFGIAKSEGMSLTRTGFTLGTPYYMAPEQVLGQQVTHLVDVYAFGVLLFELLTGKKPISGTSVEKIFNSILYEALDLEPLRQTGAPPALVELVSLCTAKTPEQRPQSFEILVRQLEAIVDNRPEPARASAMTHGAAARSARTTRPAQPRPVVPPPAPDPDLPAFLDYLPPRFRTQKWLMIIAAGAALGGMFVLYALMSIISRFM